MVIILSKPIRLISIMNMFQLYLALWTMIASSILMIALRTYDNSLLPEIYKKLTNLQMSDSIIYNGILYFA